MNEYRYVNFISLDIPMVRRLRQRPVGQTIRVEQKEELVWYLGDDEGNRYDGQEHLDRNPQLRTADGSGRMLGTLALGWGGNDTMFGTRYRDSIYGHQGNVVSGDGNDEISGGDGNDFLDGGAGNDTLISGDGSDYIRGGDGHDLIYVSSVDCQNEVVGSDDREWVYAEGGNDTVHGQQGNDFINGGDGNKLIYGEGGSDIIIGGANNDQIHGGHGDDRIMGHN